MLGAYRHGDGNGPRGAGGHQRGTTFLLGWHSCRDIDEVSGSWMGIFPSRISQKPAPKEQQPQESNERCLMPDVPKREVVFCR